MLTARIGTRPGPLSVQEAAMSRLYYRDRYGRRATPVVSRGPGVPARFFVTVLLVLAGIMVFASLIR
jgi:hypothetical protein